MSIDKRSNLSAPFRFIALIGIAVGIFCLPACNGPKKKEIKIVITNAPSEHHFAKELSDVLSPVDTPGKKELHNITVHLHYTYQLNEYGPIWLKDGKPTEKAYQFIAELQNLYWDGLDTAAYHISHLQKLL